MMQLLDIKKESARLNSTFSVKGGVKNTDQDDYTTHKKQKFNSVYSEAQLRNKSEFISSEVLESI